MTEIRFFDIVSKYVNFSERSFEYGYTYHHVYRHFDRQACFPATLEKEKRISFPVMYVCPHFFYGGMLGEKDNFFEELSTLGVTSFLFFLIPTVLSVLLVYYLTQRFMKKDKEIPAERGEEL